MNKHQIPDLRVDPRPTGRPTDRGIRVIDPRGGGGLEHFIALSEPNFS